MKALRALMSLTIICICGSCTQYELKEAGQIGPVGSIYELYDAESLDSLMVDSLHDMRALEGRDLAIAQARVWKENAELIGVSCPKIRFTEDAPNSALVWVYLFTDQDPAEWFGVAIAKFEKPLILNAGYKKMAHGSLENWIPIQDRWQCDFDSVSAPFFRQELTCYRMNDEIRCVWLGTFGDGTGVVNATTGEVIEGVAEYEFIANQRGSRTDLNDGYKPENISTRGIGGETSYPYDFVKAKNDGIEGVLYGVSQSDDETAYDFIPYNSVYARDIFEALK